eukprot:TRINITY_DN4384_c0_g3_i1.p1 TRINITY_DN4384_c0_g3~~TRINITY_DN4384_c0_g3_i1.p1  ORF type:complete len:1904 (+),score=731.59 TRINITY_DN4384_c0_g3_i1:615-5714(+)
MTFLGTKGSELRSIRTQSISNKATQEIAQLKIRLQKCHTRLAPMKAVRQEFQQRQQAQVVVKEMMQKIMPAEVEVDNAKEVVSALKKDEANEEAMTTADKAISAAQQKLNVATNFLNVKLKSAQGVVKKELEKLEERLRESSKRLVEIKAAPQTIMEQMQSDNVVKDASEKLHAAEIALMKVEKTLNPVLAKTKKVDAAAQMEAIRLGETEAAVASRAVTTARVAISTSMIEVRRHKAETQEATQTKLTNFKKTVEDVGRRLTELKNKCSEAKRGAMFAEVEEAVKRAEDAATRLTKVSELIATDEQVDEMTPETLKEHASEFASASSEATSSTKLAQDLMVQRQIEAKGTESLAGLGDALTGLKARLRAAETKVRTVKKLPGKAEKQLAIRSKVEDMITKVKEAEAKADAAMKLITEAQELTEKAAMEPATAEPEEPEAATEPAIAQPSAKGMAKPKTLAKSVPRPTAKAAGKVAGKASGKGWKAAAVEEKPLSPAQKAQQAAENAVNSAVLLLKATMRQIDMQASANKEVKEELLALKPRLEEAQKKVERGLSDLRCGEDKKQAAALLKEIPAKVTETEEAADKSAKEVEAFLRVTGNSEDDAEATKGEQEAEKGIQAVYALLTKTKTLIAVKKNMAKHYAEAVLESVTKDLDEFSAKVDAAQTKIADAKKALLGRKYAAALQLAKDKAIAAETAVTTAMEAAASLQPSDDKKEEAAESEADADAKLEASAKTHTSAQEAIAAARSYVMGQIKSLKPTADASVHREFRDCLEKVKTVETSLAECKKKVSDQEKAYQVKTLLSKAARLIENMEEGVTKAQAEVQPVADGTGDRLTAMLAMPKFIGAVRRNAASLGKTVPETIKELLKGSDKVSEEAFKAFVGSLKAEGDKANAISEEEWQAIFSALAKDGGITEEDFLKHFRTTFVVKSTIAMTDGLAVTSNSVGRLSEGMVVKSYEDPEGQDAPVEKSQKSCLRRIHVVKESDGKDGFVTIAGNQGTVYIQAQQAVSQNSISKAAEHAIQAASASCEEASQYLKQQMDFVNKACATGPKTSAMPEARRDLLRMRVKVSASQQTCEDLKKKLHGAEKSLTHKLEQDKKKREEAAQQALGDSVAEEFTTILTEALDKLSGALGSAGEAIAASKNMDPDSAEASELEKVLSAEASLQAAFDFSQEKIAEVDKAFEVKSKELSRAVMAEARRSMLKLKAKLSGMQTRMKSQMTALTAVRAKVANDAREAIAAALRGHAQAEGITSEALFAKLRKSSDGGFVPVARMTEFIKGLPDTAISETQLTLGLQSFKPGVWELDLQMIVQEHLLCVKEVAITKALKVNEPKSTLRKLDLDEVVEIIGAKQKDEVIGLFRQKCRAITDGTEGWVTLKGNAGTEFMKPTSSPYMICQAATSLQKDFEANSAAVKQLRVGDVLCLLEGPKPGSAGEIVRIRGKATKDGRIGWITKTDAAGVLMLETKTTLIVKGSTALTREFDIAAKDALMRKLEVGEKLEVIGDKRLDDKTKLTRVQVRAEDKMEGWATAMGNQGKEFLTEDSVSVVACEAGLDLQVSNSSSSRKIRRLEKGEHFEVLGDEKTEALEAPLRAKGRLLAGSSAATGSSAIGWVNFSSMEKWTPRHRCMQQCELRESSESSSKALRTLMEGEFVDVVEALAATNSADAKSRVLRIRAVKDGIVGFSAVADASGKVLLKPQL